MTQSKRIPQDRWPDFSVTFSNGNRDRPIGIEVLDNESGDSQLVRSAPFLGIAWDAPGKGNDIVITTGRDEVEYAHRIPGAAELWEAQAEDGQVTALEIVDQTGTKTIVAFRD